MFVAVWFNFVSILFSSICRILGSRVGTRAQSATTGGRRRSQRATPRSFQLLQKLRTVQQCHLVPAIMANLFIALNKRSTCSSTAAPLAAGHVVVVQCRVGHCCHLASTARWRHGQPRRWAKCTCNYTTRGKDVSKLERTRKKYNSISVEEKWVSAHAASRAAASFPRFYF